MSGRCGTLRWVVCGLLLFSFLGGVGCERIAARILGKRSEQSDPAREAFHQAVALAAAGRYEEALEKHVWFHNHALDSGPSMVGVRLSFALKEWVELGEKYPPALEKLKAIRDEKTARILGGDPSRSLFADVQSINLSLGQRDATVELFKAVAEKWPDRAGELYDFADEELIRAGEYALAARFLGDPFARLETAQRGFEFGMSYSRGQSDADRAKKAREAHEGIFEREVIRIITVLVKSGDVERAREVQVKALKTFDSPALQSAL